MKIKVPVDEIVNSFAVKKEVVNAALRETGVKIGVEAAEYLKKGMAHDGGRGKKKVYSPRGSIFPFSHSHRLQRSMGWKVTRNTARQFYFTIGSVLAKVRYFKYLADPQYSTYRSFMDSAGMRSILKRFGKYFRAAYERLHSEKVKK